MFMFFIGRGRPESGKVQSWDVSAPMSLFTASMGLEFRLNIVSTTSANNRNSRNDDLDIVFLKKANTKKPRNKVLEITDF